LHSIQTVNLYFLNFHSALLPSIVSNGFTVFHKSTTEIPFSKHQELVSVSFKQQSEICRLKINTNIFRQNILCQHTRSNEELSLYPLCSPQLSQELQWSLWSRVFTGLVPFMISSQYQAVKQWNMSN